MFLASNYVYHKYVFRANNNKLQFTAFLLVNLYTSNQIAEALTGRAAKHYAREINNHNEYEHRAILQQKLRQSLYNKGF